ncbi:cytosolic factor, phosphatidylinositol/phosphatidylcholine transfer protein [Boothiomyces macroporosus]|uniref:Cytosolic factor, phosphatidylinositol/phosphatidylcholine transfer protein n=1 Tax=Boothiomyces macroporosus TaxID=261099 RepID=A0AAD5YAH6_9FUNG|nr:cytosolic factor, phosphatidylinositol/phosphatidylcholine transfer protein [Boothiomyces macroporosus]
MSTANPQESLVAFKRIIEQKELYDPARHDDHLLYRFLRARKYDLEKTELMFRNCEEWRKAQNIDEIVSSFAFQEDSLVHAIYPRFYHKTDKLGRTIYIEQLKNLDVPKLMQTTTQERLITKHIREFEKFTRYRLPACSTKKGTHIEQGLTILDLKGVPLSQFNQVRKIIQSLSAIASDYYPETMGKMCIINAPTLFTAVWAVVKNMIDENTAAKISIMGSGYQKQLLELIDAENLPHFLGGACNCPGGCEFSDLGPWNDGTVQGYPIEIWEDFKKRDRGWAGFGVGVGMTGNPLYVGWANSTGGYTVVSAFAKSQAQPTPVSPQDITVVPLGVSAPSWAKVSFAFSRSANGISSTSSYVYAYSGTAPTGNKDSISASYTQHDNTGSISGVNFLSNSAATTSSGALSIASSFWVLFTATFALLL